MWLFYFKNFVKCLIQKLSFWGERRKLILISSVDDQHTYKQALQYYKMIPKQNMTSNQISLSSNRSSSPNSCNGSMNNENEVNWCVLFFFDSWMLDWIDVMCFQGLACPGLYKDLFWIYLTGEVHNCIMSQFPERG